jgi:beta-galactosidase
MSQLENLIRRDRNHPSVFQWSLGNEEAVADTDRGLMILTEMKAVVTRHDGTRPVTAAPRGESILGKFGFAACDVQGYNYADPEADEFHKANPMVPVMGTEQVSAVATRGIYKMDPERGYVGSYDPYTTSGRASCEGWWSFCDARPWLAGGFIWTEMTLSCKDLVASLTCKLKMCLQCHSPLSALRRTVRIRQGKIFIMEMKLKEVTTH